jgi:hypothetical protein
LTLFAYGSGASAKLFQGLLVADYLSVSHAISLAPDLHDAVRDEIEPPRGRASLSLGDYHRLHGSDDRSRVRGGEVPQSVQPPRSEFALLRYGTEAGPRKTDVGYRYYGYVT